MKNALLQFIIIYVFISLYNDFLILEGLTNQTTYVLYIRAYNQYLTKSEESDFVYATPFEPLGTDTANTTQKTSLCFINLMFSETF